MKKAVLRTVLAALALTVTSAVSAKTLVFCSEGSPENFNPQLYTSGTSVDASAVRFITGLSILPPAPPS